MINPISAFCLLISFVAAWVALSALARKGWRFYDSRDERKAMKTRDVANKQRALAHRQIELREQIERKRNLKARRIAEAQLIEELHAADNGANVLPFSTHSRKGN